MSTIIAFPAASGRAGNSARHRRSQPRVPTAGEASGANIVILPVIRIERHMDVPPPRLPDLDVGSHKPGGHNRRSH